MFILDRSLSNIGNLTDSTGDLIVFNEDNTPKEVYDFQNVSDVIYEIRYSWHSKNSGKNIDHIYIALLDQDNDHIPHDTILNKVSGKCILFLLIPNFMKDKYSKNIHESIKESIFGLLNEIYNPSQDDSLQENIKIYKRKINKYINYLN